MKARPWWALVLVSTVSVADEDRWDHAGSLGLLVAAGSEFRNAPTVNGVREFGFRANLDVGGTVAIGHTTWQAMVDGRLTLGGPQLGLAFIGGLRNSFGEQIKSFVELTAAVHVLPYVIVGPRVGFGLQYEITPVLGMFALTAIQFGGGATLRLGVEVTAGVQLRSYLLE